MSIFLPQVCLSGQNLYSFLLSFVFIKKTITRLSVWPGNAATFAKKVSVEIPVRQSFPGQFKESLPRGALMLSVLKLAVYENYFV